MTRAMEGRRDLVNMLPASYQMPAAIVLLVGGVVACFFGYRLFRIVLALFGFILGALAASSIFGMSDTGPMIGAAVAGGLVGAGDSHRARISSASRSSAPALGAVVANLAFAAGDRDPHYLAVVFLSIAGATAAMLSSALLHHRRHRLRRRLDDDRGGDGASSATGRRWPRPQAATCGWRIRMNPAPGQQWVPIAWMALGAIGTGVQLGITGGEKGRVGRRNPVVRRRKKT